MFIFLCIVGGYLYATWLEWALHKYILHGLGKNKNSWFNYHWHDHHQRCRKNKNVDDSYANWLSPSVRREILSLYALKVVHLPLYFVMPWFYYTICFCAVRYFYMHQKAHQDVEWAKKYMPWHYDHHMGRNQHANWGVTTAFWDLIMGTREKYYDENEVRS